MKTRGLGVPEKSLAVSREEVESSGRVELVLPLPSSGPAVSCRGQHHPVQLLHLREHGGVLLAPKALFARSLLPTPPHPTQTSELLGSPSANGCGPQDHPLPPGFPAGRHDLWEARILLLCVFGAVLLLGVLSLMVE